MSVEPIIISLDGNIGSGKTTSLEILRKSFPNIHFIDEPVNAWMQFTNENGESLLQNFYKDRKRWAYTFQNCAFMTRVRAISKAVKDWEKSCKENPENLKHNIFVTERCVETDFHVFAKMLHEDGSINKMEWDIYRSWYRFLSTDHKLNGIFYVNASPDACKKRISYRNRNGEEEIPLEYLTQLGNYHKNWIDNTTVPVFNFDNEEDSSVCEKDVCDSFNNFVKSLN
jgi:deoxyadenosine/deoxycytidine kinase